MPSSANLSIWGICLIIGHEEDDVRLLICRVRLAYGKVQKQQGWCETPQIVSFEIRSICNHCEVWNWLGYELRRQEFNGDWVWSTGCLKAPPISWHLIVSLLVLKLLPHVFRIGAIAISKKVSAQSIFGLFFGSLARPTAVGMHNCQNQVNMRFIGLSRRGVLWEKSLVG